MINLDNATVSRIKHALETAHETLPLGAHVERHEVMRALNALCGRVGACESVERG